MSARVIAIRADHGDIPSVAVDLAVEAASQVTRAESDHFADQVRALVDQETTRRIGDRANDLKTVGMEEAARLGFFLGLTMTTHGILGYRAWLAEALRLAGHPADVEYRQQKEERL